MVGGDNIISQIMLKNIISDCRLTMHLTVIFDFCQFILNLKKSVLKGPLSSFWIFGI